MSSQAAAIAPSGARAAPPPGGRRRPVADGVHLMLPLAILAAWGVAIDGVRLRDMTDLGLVSVTPPVALVLVAVLTMSFCVALARRPPGVWIPLAHVLVLIVILFGVTAFLEPYPRVSPAWRHTGIIDHLQRTAAVDSGIDAYFNWPGFFGVGALVSDAAGFATPLAMAGWAPLAFNVLFLAPLTVILRWASDDPRVTWLGLWIFYSANWVGQDYFSPQAMAFLLWLAMLGVLLTWFTPRPPALGSRLSPRTLLDLRRLPDPADKVERTGSRRRRTGLIVAAVALYAAVVTGHQLTPFVAVIAVTALVFFGRMELRLLPLAMLILLAAWLGTASRTYLSAHFEELAGPLVAAGENLDTSVSARVGGSADHEFIVYIRLLSSAAIWGLALAGLARRVRAGRSDVALVAVALAPTVLVLVQPYGGEMVLRLFVFSLPAAAFLIASLAFPTAGAGHGWGTIAGVTLLCCALLATFQFTRYGNERLDYMSRGDVAAVSALYRAAPRGATLIGAENTPWRHHDYVGYDYRGVSDFPAWDRAAPDARELVRQIEAYPAEKGTFVIVTRSAKVYASMLTGKEPALSGLVEVLRASPTAVEVYRGRDGDVFFLPA